MTTPPTIPPTTPRPSDNAAGTDTSITTAGLLRQAVGLHQGGQLQQAETLYRDVLQREPQQFDALHLLGVLARQGGAADDAVALIGRALAIDPRQAIAHCNLGAALQDLRRHEEALASFERALALQPAYPLALVNRGNALRKLGRPGEAVASYDAALAIAPQSLDALCNRGVALQLLGDAEAALDSFGRALTLQPDHAPSYAGAAVALQQAGMYEQAREAYRNALELHPDDAEGWCNHGTLMQRLGEHEEALASCERALRIAPGSPRVHLQRGHALRALGEQGAAIGAYRDALSCGADAASVAYLLAALGSGAAPSAPPPQYVAALFDQYAFDFDHHLQQVLAYRAPQLLIAALAPHVPAQRGAVLDLGCGTGLCGPLLRPYAATLAGADLSARMLEQAARHGLYDELACADLVTFLAGRPAGSAALAVAADVFVYVGELAPAFAAARGALRTGGLFALTVEALDDEEPGGFRLRPSGRYAHGRAYVETLVATHGFTVRAMTRDVLRQDAGSDVAGWIVVLEKAPG